MIVSRATPGCRRTWSVVISPETITRPVLTSVSHATRPVGIVAQHGVEHAVGDLVGDLVRVTLGHRLGREQVLVVGKRLHGISRRSSVVVSPSPLAELRPIVRTWPGRGALADRAPLVSPVCSPRRRSWLKSVKSTEDTCSADRRARFCTRCRRPATAAARDLVDRGEAGRHDHEPVEHGVVDLEPRTEAELVHGDAADLLVGQPWDLSGSRARRREQRGQRRLEPRELGLGRRLVRVLETTTSDGVGPGDSATAVSAAEDRRDRVHVHALPR